MHQYRSVLTRVEKLVFIVMRSCDWTGVGNSLAKILGIFGLFWPGRTVGAQLWSLQPLAASVPILSTTVYACIYLEVHATYCCIQIYLYDSCEIEALEALIYNIKKISCESWKSHKPRGNRIQKSSQNGMFKLPVKCLQIS
jgi:hypothetical protein